MKVIKHSQRGLAKILLTVFIGTPAKPNGSMNANVGLSVFRRMGP